MGNDMTNARDSFDKKLKRLQTWSERCGRALEREMATMEDLYRKSIAELESEKQQATRDFTEKEIEIRSRLDATGKEFQLEKYRVEKDKAAAQADLERAAFEESDVQKRFSLEISRLNEERVAFQVSWERQKSALNDLYQEKKRHISVVRAALVRDLQAAEQKMKKLREKTDREMEQITGQGTKTISALSEQAEARKQGWAVARETMRRELDALVDERNAVTKKIADLRAEKEKELENARMALLLSKEQLDVDKATLVEKAEDDQRQCEREVKELQENLAAAEKSFETFVLEHEKRKKDTEEAYARDEGILKESVKTESEKRDYEQKLFEQEKVQREREIGRLREELEKRTWHWDNQIRTLLLQKSVQDAEYDAERMRVDREARAALRGLEAKRDELRQRLNELKARHAGLDANAKKEMEVISQRWQFRRDRLWSVWQARLDALKKERETLHEQIAALQETFQKERKRAEESEKTSDRRINELETFLISSSENQRGDRKQRDIQFELEKTRVLAQIKECETHVAEWMDRLKRTQQEVGQRGAGLSAELGFLDRWYRQEETETAAFLKEVHDAVSALQDALVRAGVQDAA